MSSETPTDTEDKAAFVGTPTTNSAATRTGTKAPKVAGVSLSTLAAGAWHAAVVGRDGRVCTWGWGRYGCLGHGNEECESAPKVVEALSNVNHVATGDYTTFVVSDDGDVYEGYLQFK
ncbi:hypothetical protein PIB30_046625 [Stylosanthes scabra]|uniref:Uncharacterized protein n=1 Tax=Stylosanthes scabra TaxID=79078 RepID=A0ABU6UF53_9FABA|nr:hypothetical protein [Stylosanthes scabra]